MGIAWAYPPPVAPPLIPNTGPKGGLAQREARLFAQAGKAVRKSDGNRGFSFTGRGRADCSHKDQFTVRAALLFFQHLQGYLGDTLSIRNQIFIFNAEFSAITPIGSAFTEFAILRSLFMMFTPENVISFT